ncbi:hypothetical protein [Desulfosporosinus acidiphilus]|uniref:hypothetical protein n=1 Tax=Desulfosporosinus acidiphilus TaxID=885581 RepID=UPI0002FD414A|nr:hypothetical protein [Desulfosporosinus acidiphilus]
MNLCLREEIEGFSSTSNFKPTTSLPLVFEFNLDEKAARRKRFVFVIDIYDHYDIAL